MCMISCDPAHNSLQLKCGNKGQNTTLPDCITAATALPPVQAGREKIETSTAPSSKGGALGGSHKFPNPPSIKRISRAYNKTHPAPFASPPSFILPQFPHPHLHHSSSSTGSSCWRSSDSGSVRCVKDRFPLPSFGRWVSLCVSVLCLAVIIRIRQSTRYRTAALGGQPRRHSAFIVRERGVHEKLIVKVDDRRKNRRSVQSSGLSCSNHPSSGAGRSFIFPSFLLWALSYCRGAIELALPTTTPTFPPSKILPHQRLFPNLQSDSSQPISSQSLT